MLFEFDFVQLQYSQKITILPSPGLTDRLGFLFVVIWELFISKLALKMKKTQGSKAFLCDSTEAKDELT